MAQPVEQLQRQRVKTHVEQMRGFKPGLT